MAVLKVKIAGRDVTFQSEDDFARGIAALERVDETPEKNRGGKSATSKNNFDAMQGTVGFLTEIMEAGKQGVDSTVIARVLHCEPRGIGRRVLEVTDILKSAGFKNKDAIFSTKRLAEGGRLYMPEADLPAALEAVKRKAGSG